MSLWHLLSTLAEVFLALPWPAQIGVGAFSVVMTIVRLDRMVNNRVRGGH